MHFHSTRLAVGRPAAPRCPIWRRKDSLTYFGRIDFKAAARGRHGTMLSIITINISECFAVKRRAQQKPRPRHTRKIDASETNAINGVCRGRHGVRGVEMAPGAQKCYAETWLILERQHDGFMTVNILNVLSCYHAVIFMVVNSEVYIICFTKLYILLWRARAWSIYPYLSIYLSTQFYYIPRSKVGIVSTRPEHRPAPKIKELQNLT